MYKTAKDFLEYLNKTYHKLHKDYEDVFWLYRMGNYKYGDIMNKKESLRDSFRSNKHLRLVTINFLKKSNGENKERLTLWKDFFDLYISSDEALAIKKKIADLENKVLEKRSNRKEGYINPHKGSFVPARENEMRIIMRTNSDEAIRKACFLSMEKLPYDTLDEYIEIVKLRNKLAIVQGYGDFYEYKLHIDEGISKAELFKIFDDIYEKTKYAFSNIRNLEREMEKDKPDLRKPWNFSYYFSGSFAKEEDSYFKFDNVLSYWGKSFSALGIDFANGELKLDLIERKGKWNNGFCHYPKVVFYKKGKRMNGSSNFTSNANPNQIGSGIQGINTVFHEAGHAADRLNSFQKDACINTEYPPGTVSWAETQSMFLDSISSSIEWKVRYAKDKDGKSYPFELYERKLRSIYPLLPLSMMNIMRIVYFEKEIYECKDLTRDFVIETAKKIYKKYFDQSEDSIAILNTPHIYSSESSAYYHGYGLAELGVSQWRKYFYKKYGYIIDNPKVGRELKNIWFYASLYPARKLIRMATGKPLSPDSFIEDVTMPLDKILKISKERLRNLEKIKINKKIIKLKARITMVHGKKKISDNKKSFEDMDKKYKRWLSTLS